MPQINHQSNAQGRERILTRNEEKVQEQSSSARNGMNQTRTERTFPKYTSIWQIRVQQLSGVMMRGRDELTNVGCNVKKSMILFTLNGEQ